MIGDIAHICNRGVDKRKIFRDNADYERFRDNLFLLNNVSGKIRTKHKDIFLQTEKLPKQEKLVEVLKWTLMPNHYHLLLYELVEGGIVEYVKRIGNAYTKYFNIRDEKRSGYLFQNSAQIIRLVDNRHFLYIPYYIDLNPAELTHKKDIKFLLEYKWASFKDYFGKNSDLPIINKDLFYEEFGLDERSYYSEIRDFIKDREKLAEFEQGVNLAG